MKKVMSFLFATLFIIGSVSISTAETVYINNYEDFPVYDYNTSTYRLEGAYVGCGPTTGAMILGYFQNVMGFDPSRSGGPDSRAWDSVGAARIYEHKF